jgi:acetate kinase
MATRSGTIDPGTLLFLVRHGIEVEYFYDTLEHRSGMLGVSGVSGDVREVMDQAARGNARARLAYDMFLHSVTRVTGGMIAALEGIDALTFTGGVGEHQAIVRQDIANALAYVGVSVDEHANQRGAGDREIGDRAASVRVTVVRSREDLSVLRGVKGLMGRQFQQAC